MLKVRCSKCQKKIALPDNSIGKRVKCPHCEYTFTIDSTHSQNVETAISFFCIQCGHKMRVPKGYAGKKGKCPQCQTLCTVPSQDNQNNQGTKANSGNDSIGKTNVIAQNDHNTDTPDSLNVDTNETEYTPEVVGMKLKGPTKQCPYCGEAILEVAKKCKHCGEFLDDSNGLTPISTEGSETKTQQGVSFNQEGDVVFSGSFDQASEMIIQTINEAGGKIIKADPYKGYIEGKFKYGINLFGIRVCVYLRNEGSNCLIGFRGKLKDAIDTFGHARKKSDEVKARFIDKIQRLPLATNAYGNNNNQTGRSIAPPQPYRGNDTSGTTGVSPNSHDGYRMPRSASYDDEPLGVGWLVLAWFVTLSIPIGGIISGTICCSKKRVGNGVCMIVISVLSLIGYFLMF